MQSPIAIFLIAFVAAFIIIKAAVFLLSFVIIQAVTLWANISAIRYNLSVGYYHIG